LNSGILVYSVFTYISDFVQTQNEAKILTAFLRTNLNVLLIPLRLQGRVKDISSPQPDICSQDKDATAMRSQDEDKN